MNRIKEILDEKGIKQTWLANNLNKSYNVVNGYVNNVRQPSVEVLFRISELLGVSVKDLLKENKELNVK
jgi:putative transcriptional regulator